VFLFSSYDQLLLPVRYAVLVEVESKLKKEALEAESTFKKEASVTPGHKHDRKCSKLGALSLSVPDRS
jgi:hypothetical protein